MVHKLDVGAQYVQRQALDGLLDRQWFLFFWFCHH